MVVTKSAPASRLGVVTMLLAMLTVGFSTTTAHAQRVDVGAGIEITDIDLEGVTLVNGVLRATGGTVEGFLSGLPFTADIENLQLQVISTGPAAGCSVLDLELGPIDVDLLGLHVDTSPICLQITAIPGGGLLGDLLCGLAGLNLNDLLAGLLDALPAVLEPVLNQALTNNGPSAANAPDICDGECEILDLALGPVNLTLLGLNVVLDNCDGGPVQVCVSASEGEGLLGDLLCGLADGSILPSLGDIEELVGGLLDVLDADLTDKQINKVVQQVRRAIRNGDVSGKEINQLTRLITRLIG